VGIPVALVLVWTAPKALSTLAIVGLLVFNFATDRHYKRRRNVGRDSREKRN